MTPGPTASPQDQPERREQARRSPTSVGAYLTALGDEVGTQDLTPTSLARGIVKVLPVDGASLSLLVDVLRLPLGASDSHAQQAETLQTTLGEGPCLEAAETQQAVVVDLDDLQSQWDLYGDELLATTPYRSVASIPLNAPGHGIFAALDLYSTRPRLSDDEALHRLVDLTPTVAALLSALVADVGDIDLNENGPDWYRISTARRHDVWIAIGMLISASTRPALGNREALSLLRAHAYTSSLSLDDLATNLANGHTPLTELTR